jgi:hypothetical protein
MILLIYSVCASIIPLVNAEELTAQNRAITVLRDVVGINTESYATVLHSELDDPYLSLPQKTADVYLVSDKGGLRATCSFVNNVLRQIYLSDYKGDLAVEQPATKTAEIAKGFLQRYQNYAGDAFYGELASTLNNVDVSTNITKSTGNIKLEVLNWDQTIVDYVWTYTDENEIVAEAKNVILSYDRGQLKVFLNNWPLYTVVGTPKISSKEATAIAIEASKNFSYEIVSNNVTSTVTGFKIAPESLGYATLSYLNFKDSSSARGGDPFTLYPSWYVPLGFDTFYVGDVTGITVSIWADTGKLSTMGPMVADIANDISAAKKTDTQGFNQDSATLSAPIMIIAIFSAVGVSLVSRKKISTLLGNKRLFSKFWGTLICGIILLNTILVAIPAVNASSTIPNSRSRVYACLDTPDGYEEPAYTPEREATVWVCGQVANAFVSSGYTTYNLAGEGTLYSDVYSQAAADCQYCDRATVFHVGHRATGGYQDNWGTPILADEILARTTGTHKFVFLWVCDQVKNPAFGMPYAWTQRNDMSEKGYLKPDCDGQCVIGFKGFSPIISGYHQTFQSQMTGPCKDFIKSFYDYALCNSYSVRDALNLASIGFFQHTYTTCPLYGEDGTGYMAWYPISGQYESGYMRVFGDGSMWIFQPKITLTANCGLSPKFYLDGEQCSVGDVHVWAPNVVTVDVEEVHNYEFDHFSYHGNTYSAHPANMGLYFDDTLTAVYNWDPVYYTLSVSAGTGGTTESPYTPGNHQCLSYSTAHVVADPDPNWALDHWVLDGENAGNDLSIDVLMDEPHTLEAVFTPAPSYNYVASIHSYGGAVYNQANLVGWQSDSQFAHLEGLGYYGVTGWIAGTMDDQATGHIYVKGRCVSGGATDLYVYVSSNGYNWNYVSAPYVSSTSAYWIDCGTYGGTFSYIKVLVQPAGWGELELDSVRVDP